MQNINKIRKVKCPVLVIHVSVLFRIEAFNTFSYLLKSGVENFAMLNEKLIAC